MEYQSLSTLNKPSPSKATSSLNSPQYNKNPKVESLDSLSKAQKAILKRIYEDPQYAKKLLSEDSFDEILFEFLNESYDPIFGGPCAQDPYDF